MGAASFRRHRREASVAKTMREQEAAQHALKVAEQAYVKTVNEPTQATDQAPTPATDQDVPRKLLTRK